MESQNSASQEIPTSSCNGDSPAIKRGFAKLSGKSASAIEEHWLQMQRMSQKEWQKVLAMLPARTSSRAGHGGNARHFVEAVLWVAQTGAHWSDLPPAFGKKWHGIYVRFIRWAQDGNWEAVLKALDEGDKKVDLENLVQRYLSRTRAKKLNKLARHSA